jgi:hypothetical protein
MISNGPKQVEPIESTGIACKGSWYGKGMARKEFPYPSHTKAAVKSVISASSQAGRVSGDFPDKKEVQGVT